MDLNKFNEAKLLHEIILEVEKKKLFWNSLENAEYKKIGYVRMTNELENKIHLLVQEVIKEHDIEIKRLTDKIKNL